MELISNSQTWTLERSPEFSRELVVRFVAYLDVKPKTIETYSRAIKQFFNFLHSRKILKPIRQDVVDFRNKLISDGKRASTVKTYITATRLFFRFLEQEGIYKNIAERIKGAKVESGYKKDALTINQVQRLLSLFAECKKPTAKRDYAVFLLMITCGLRTIEVVRANIEDFRPLGDKLVLYVHGKGKDEKSEFVLITPETESAIRAYLETRKSAKYSDPLFSSTSNNSAGNPLTTRSISGMIKNMLIKAGLNSNRLTAHSLRHTAITLALLGGSTLQEASQFARHANITTTEIYAHNLDRMNNDCSSVISSAIFNKE